MILKNKILWLSLLSFYCCARDLLCETEDNQFTLKDFQQQNLVVVLAFVSIAVSQKCCANRGRQPLYIFGRFLTTKYPIVVACFCMFNCCSRDLLCKTEDNNQFMFGRFLTIKSSCRYFCIWLSRQTKQSKGRNYIAQTVRQMAHVIILVFVDKQIAQSDGFDIQFFLTTCFLRHLPFIKTFSIAVKRC